MNLGAQSLVRRCSGGNFSRFMHSHVSKFSSASSSKTNSENAVQSTTLQPTLPSSSSSGETKQLTVPLTFVESDGRERLVQAEIGKHLLDVAHDNHVELEGACGGELSCSTCHLIFEPHIYEKLTPKLDDEQDMLDLAFGVTETYVYHLF